MPASRYQFPGLCWQGANCVKDNCQREHDIHTCACGVVMSRSSVRSHLAGKRHAQNLQSQGLQADVSHQQPPVSQPRSSSGVVHCNLCEKGIPAPSWNHHLSQRTHLDAIQTALSQAGADKNGVEISEPAGVDFGVVEQTGTAAPRRSITLRSSNSNTRITLVDYKFSSSKTKQTPSFSVSLQSQNAKLNSGRGRVMWITCAPAYEGRHQETLELTFFNVVQRQQFSITRQICAVAGSSSDQEELKPKAPYVKRKWVPLPLDGKIITVLRPPSWTETQWVTRLPEFPAPKALTDAAYGRDGNLAAVRRFMPTVFNHKTYGLFFENLLWIEEEQRNQDLGAYGMTDVQLSPRHPRYLLQVAGLAEGRPSVLVGDFILVKRQDGSSTEWYKGCVHEIFVDYVSLRFASTFSTYQGTLFEVRFVLNRLPLRRMHQAIILKSNVERIAFPEKRHVKSIPVTTDQLRAIVPINRLIGEDHEQLLTVAAILHQPPGSAPFVIFGPPGTGKTITVVEAIKQLLASSPDVRILACAPSNSAADLIAQRLDVLGPTELFRLNAASRECKRLPESLKDFSLINGNGVFAIPSLERLSGFKVIVSTCISGGVPHGLGVKRGHFSHIFVDEAGQCMEPDVMIPILTMAGPKTNIVLAGDNRQLGPSVRSDIASSLGLGKSFLTRIMARDVYNLETHTGITIVKLIKNFRSHPAILHFSNANFYQGELRAHADPVITHSLLRSDLVQQSFPFLFHSIVGKDQREESSPSFFNIEEVTRVKKYCEELMEDRRLRLRVEDIGIITPYHAQRCKIGRVLMGNPKLRGIKVGSVEEFQGQERRIIIMSTVRSSADYLRYDMKHTLGFVANPRRLNVAITRAQALMIIVGNPTVLSLDPMWRTLLNYIHGGGGWRGKHIQWNPLDPVLPGGYDQERRDQAHGEAEEMLARLRAHIVDNTEDLAAFGQDVSDNESAGEGFMDNGVWREEE